MGEGDRLTAWRRLARIFGERRQFAPPTPLLGPERLAQDGAELVFREAVLCALDGREVQDLLLDVRREERVVHDLRDAGAREPELAREVGEVARHALVDHPLEPVRLGEQARDARESARDLGRGGCRAIAHHDPPRSLRDALAFGLAPILGRLDPAGDG